MKFSPVSFNKFCLIKAFQAEGIIWNTFISLIIGSVVKKRSSYLLLCLMECSLSVVKLTYNYSTIKDLKFLNLRFNSKINLKVFYVYTLNWIIGYLKNKISKVSIKDFDVKIEIKKSKYLILVLSYLKLNPFLKFKLLSDIVVIDYLYSLRRFEVRYNLLSIFYNARLNVSLLINEFSLLPTISNIYKSAFWQEREIWDLFGIFINSHPDLRRILTDYGFRGYPLRKDFPLTGFFELYYNYSQKRIIYEPVNLSQRYRTFNFIRKW